MTINCLQVYVLNIYTIKIAMRGVRPMNWPRRRLPSISVVLIILFVLSPLGRSYRGNHSEHDHKGTTASVEPTVNDVAAKRTTKKQQMQWFPEGAHTLIQTRTATLNGEHSQYFERWFLAIPEARNENRDRNGIKLAARE